MIQQYLALGDSYTIGEGVALFHSFPYQLTQALRNKGISVSAPEIIARTGFTTDELLSQVAATTILPKYQLVTILIGVNNQYRGLSIVEFETGFKKILDVAIQAVCGDTEKVYVLSIPDYGKSPFARQLDKMKISEEITQFNTVKEVACKSRQVRFTDITTTANQIPDATSFVEDGLHPSPGEYGRWVNLLLKDINLKSY